MQIENNINMRLYVYVECRKVREDRPADSRCWVAAEVSIATRNERTKLEEIEPA